MKNQCVNIFSIIRKTNRKTCAKFIVNKMFFIYRFFGNISCFVHLKILLMREMRAERHVNISVNIFISLRF
jgi:hypothetical protein